MSWVKELYFYTGCKVSDLQEEIRKEWMSSTERQLLWEIHAVLQTLLNDALGIHKDYNRREEKNAE